MKLLILGSDGMVGHVVKQYMSESGHEVVDCQDADDLDTLQCMISTGNFDAVINCTAVINQDAEDNKFYAVKVNSLLPHFLETVTVGLKTVVIHRSTDCIFSGLKGNYTLEDQPDATSFYARSKALGELHNEKDITIRTSLIGPEEDEDGTGLFNWFFNQQGEVRGFANAIWTGVTTIEYSKGIEWLLTNKKHGIFQLVPNYAISKFDLLCLFEKYYPGDRTVNRVENKRVDKSLVQVCAGYQVADYETMVKEMRKWTDSHKNIYRYQ